MRIAMFGHKRIPSREGGVEVVVTELASRMAAMGHEITCYNRSGGKNTNDRENLPQTNSCPDVRIKRVWTINARGLAAMTSSLSAAFCTAFGKYDVVHIHAEGPAAMCWIPKLFGKRVIVTIHGLDWKRAKWGGFATRYIKWGEKQAAKYADEIIVLSRNIQDYFKKTYNRKTVFIPNGVIKPTNREPQIIKEKWGLDKDSYVLFVGRLVPEKGIHYLLEAWNTITSEKKLVIVGCSSDTDNYYGEIKGCATDSVIFTGFQQGDALRELYSNAYVYVLPSDLEGMPISLLEAMSYGNCCLTSDIPECTEVIEDRAAVFKHGNVEDLKRELQLLLDDIKIVSYFKDNSSVFVLNKYSWSGVVEQTMETCYESTL